MIQLLIILLALHREVLVMIWEIPLFLSFFNSLALDQHWGPRDRSGGLSACLLPRHSVPFVSTSFGTLLAPIHPLRYPGNKHNVKTMQSDCNAKQTALHVWRQPSSIHLSVCMSWRVSSVVIPIHTLQDYPSLRIVIIVPCQCLVRNEDLTPEVCPSPRCTKRQWPTAHRSMEKNKE